MAFIRVPANCIGSPSVSTGSLEFVIFVTASFVIFGATIAWSSWITNRKGK